MSDIAVHCGRLMFLSGVMALAVTGARATTPSFTLLGDLPGGSFQSRGNGISADGSVATGLGFVPNSSGSYEAFRWTAPLGMVSIGEFPGAAWRGSGLDANIDGSVIVGSSTSANGEEAFVWTEATGMIALGDLPGGSYSSQARAVNGDGTIVVGASRFGNSNDLQAFIWSAETGMVGLGHSGILPESEANDISRYGLVIVGSTTKYISNSYVTRASRWTIDTGWVQLPGLPDVDGASTAHATNADGSIVVGQEGGITTHVAFMWAENIGTVSLGPLPEGFRDSNATDVSFDGTVIVGTATIRTDQQAMIWTPYTGWVPMTATLQNILGIHVIGTIIGSPALSDDGRTIVSTAEAKLYDADTNSIAEYPLACRITLPGPGACCVGGECIDNLDPIVCATYCGVFISDEDTCATIACNGFGACIFQCAASSTPPCPNESKPLLRQCVVLSETDCIAADGLFVGGDCNCQERYPRCPTDVNGDGDTDAGDFNIMAANFGQGNPQCKAHRDGDLNCDGLVNTADFNILASEFGCGD